MEPNQPELTLLRLLHTVDILVFLVHSSHTHRQPFNSPLSGTTQVSWYQKEHSPTHTHPDPGILFNAE